MLRDGRPASQRLHTGERWSALAPGRGGPEGSLAEVGLPGEHSAKLMPTDVSKTRPRLAHNVMTVECEWKFTILNSYDNANA